jgi:hypothetical protein
MSDGTFGARDEGFRLLQAGDTDAALPLLQQAVTQNPADARSHGFLGVVHARRGDLPAAIASLQQAVRLQPADAASHYNLAVVLVQAGRNAEARAELEHALSLSPGHANALELLGRIGGVAPTAPAPPPFSPPADPAAATVAQYGGPGGPPPPLGAPAGASPWSPPSPPAGPYPAPAAWNAPSPVEVPSAYPFTHPSTEEAPGLGLRVLRGFLWGMVFGQYWTLWSSISLFLWRAGSLGRSGGMGILLIFLIYVAIYSMVGAVTGIIIGLANLAPDKGSMVGVGGGMVAMGLRALLFQNPFQFINVFFFFFTGRYVGAGIAAKVQAPVVR